MWLLTSVDKYIRNKCFFPIDNCNKNVFKYIKVFKMTEKPHEKTKHHLHSIMKAKGRNKTEYLNALQKLRPLDNNEKKLHRAVTVNHTESVQELLREDVNPNAFDGYMRTPLHLAASRGYKDCIKLLLLYGADPNQRDIIGNTPLHLAACTNNIDIVTMLVDAGTDVNSLDQHGRSPLQLAEGKLKMLQCSHKAGLMEIPHIQEQVQQVINLMMSFLKVKVGDTEHLEKLKEDLDNSAHGELDDHISKVMQSLKTMSLK